MSSIPKAAPVPFYGSYKPYPPVDPQQLNIRRLAYDLPDGVVLEWPIQQLVNEVVRLVPVNVSVVERPEGRRASEGRREEC